MRSFPGYTIHTTLRENGNTAVYRATRQHDQHPVILKTTPEPITPFDVWARQNRAYELHQLCAAPQVVAAYTLEKYHQRWVLVLEDFGGEPLSDFLADGPLPLGRFFPLAIGLVESLTIIHQRRVIHKDINPRNILVNPTTNQVKLTDFDIASLLARESNQVVTPDLLEGTLAYISPEQTGRMNRPLDFRTDFYSVGATFYEMLTGRVPFPTADLMELMHSHLARLPEPADHVNPAVPPLLAAVVLKLMAKTAEARYQSCAGLLHDLRLCYEAWQTTAAIPPFPLGQHDISDQFQIPPTLYGREQEIGQLLAAFQRARTGSAELLLVTGYSGIGKSSLVKEIHKPIVAERGHFCAGKFDQFQRQTPYASLLHALRDLLRQLLTQPPTQLAIWRHRLQEALGHNGRLFTTVLPELIHIIGDQPAVAQLPPAEAQNRFNLLFLRLIRTLATAEQPLVLFLDDLQWADAASLKLLELLMASTAETPHLLLIAAYRDNEVPAAHPLALLLGRLREANAPVTTLRLHPLSVTHTTQLLADTLHHSPDRVYLLAELCHQKTDGNPFFLGQFLHTLHDDGLIYFETTTHQWQWRMRQIHGREMTANVVELMASKIQKLPLPSQTVLFTAASLGNQFDLAALAAATGHSHTAVAHHLWPALQEGYLLPLDESYRLLDALPSATSTLALPHHTAASIRYKFAHDRIQQAAYSLIPTAERPALHLRLGRALRHHTPAEEQDGRLFEVVNQFNLALPLLETAAERHQVALLNLQAGERALSSAAYEPATLYLQTSYDLLAPDSWLAEPDLARRVHQQLATAAYLNGRYDQVMQLAHTTAAHTPDPIANLPLVELQILAKVAQHQPQEAITLALPVLAQLGVQLPPRPTDAEQMACFQQLGVLLGQHPLPTLPHQPHLTDPHQLAISRILALITSPAAFYSPRLTPLVAYELASRGMVHGHTPFSAYGYALMGSLFAGIVGNVPLGVGLGQVAQHVVGQFDNQLARGRTGWMVWHYINHWSEPWATTLPPLQEAYEVALEAGDMEYAAYSAFAYVIHALYAGRPWPKLAADMATYGEAIGRAHHETAAQWLAIYQQMGENLRGQASPPTLLRGTFFDETAVAEAITQSGVGSVRFHYHAAKLTLAYLFEQWDEALVAADQGARDVAKLVSHPSGPVFYLLEMLTRMACWPTADSATQAAWGQLMAERIKLFGRWAKQAKATHLAISHSLLQAEWARVQGEPLTALEAYDSALAQARAANIGWLEGIAAECAARFYEAWGKGKLAAVYWRDAYEAYRFWGAAAKVAQIKQSHPWLADERRGGDTMHSFQTTVTKSTNKGDVYSTLDIMAATRAAQAIASEVVLPNLLEKVLRLVLESAGAQVGYLLLPQENGEWQIEVAGRGGGAEISVASQPALPHLLPLSVVHYASRAQEEVVLAQATAMPQFAADPYIQAQQVQSLLCLPLLNRGALIGLLYLENNLMANAFTADHLAMLYVLSAQAAVSIDNARLYEKLTVANEQLESYSRNLEDKVDERTAELQSAVAELNAFAHTVAHDLKSPLSGIIGYSEIVIEELEEYEGIAPDLGEFLQRVVDGGHRMRRIIDGLLTLAMTRDGHVETGPLNMYQMALEIHERFLYAITEKGAQFEAAQEWPTAVGYGPWVEEVWANYVSNALKYGGREGIPPHIQLGSTPQANGLIRFWVRDNGMGMTAEQIAKIFTPFTRLSQIDNDSHGLGLSIVERIVAKLGGTVGVESEIGVGSVFYFTLPNAEGQ